MLTTHRGQSVNHNYFVFTSVVSLQVAGSVYNDILHEFEFSHSLSLDQTQLSSSSSDSRMGRRTGGPSGSIQFMAL